MVVEALDLLLVVVVELGPGLVVAVEPRALEAMVLLFDLLKVVVPCESDLNTLMLPLLMLLMEVSVMLVVPMVLVVFDAG